MNEIEEWISLREFNRRRGVSLAAVQKAIKNRRVTAVRRNAAGKLIGIEFHAATRQWNCNTDPDQAARAGAPVLPNPDPIQPVVGVSSVNGVNDVCVADLERGEGMVPHAPRADDPGGAPVALQSEDDKRYLAARARKQEFEAKQVELDYMEALGLLVAAAEVGKSAREVGRQLRNSQQGTLDRIRPLVTSHVYKLIDDEFRRHHDEFCSGLEQRRAVTSGVAEFEGSAL